ncbi:MAG: SDR family NAD(P)-dependent oxidoreductase [Egibacteraceae bacterium]
MSVTRTLLAGSAAVAGATLFRRVIALDLHGRVVLVTGGSRGFGLALARRFAEEGAAVAICARSRDEVERAVADLEGRGAIAIGFTVDVGDRDAVEAMVAETIERLGGLDVVVNNAGVITVGPLEAQTPEDFEAALRTMFWGTYHTTMAALGHLRTRSDARVVTIGSIGGKVSVPHLLPYSVGKFATVGFSEGLRSALTDSSVKVTTVIPGLMRTGSHRRALTKGDHAAEYRWFSLGAVLPVTATSAEHAARRVVEATKRGDAEVIITWQAHLLARLHGLAPGLTTRVLGAVARLLPDAPSDTTGLAAVEGGETGGGLAGVEWLGERAVRRLHED